MPNKLENKHELKVKYRYKLIHTCNISKACQWHKPVESWYGVKYLQLNKYPKKGTLTTSYKRASWLGNSPNSNKPTIKRVFQHSCLSLILNNIIYVFSACVVFLYTVNGIHEKSMLVPNGIWKN